MTTKELFDEYANIIYNLRVDPKYHYCATGRTLEGIIQEVEALVRKETIEDILNVIQEEGLTGVINNKWCDIISVKEIKEYAQSKGVTL